MKWLLLMIVVEVNGEFTVNMLSDHETMAQCYFASTFIDLDERMPVNQEYLCMPTDRKDEQ